MALYCCTGMPSRAMWKGPASRLSLVCSGPDAHYSFPVDGLFPGHTYQFYVVASGYGEKGVASPS